jgi:hypothetical protein
MNIFILLTLFEIDLFHVYSNNVNKFELLELINKKFDLQLKINESFDKAQIDRRLTTSKKLQNKISFKSIQQQIEEL